MRRRERHLIYEGAGLLLSGAGLAFAIPTLVSQHDSVALMAAGLLGLAWASWASFFAYRLNQEK